MLTSSTNISMFPAQATELLRDYQFLGVLQPNDDYRRENFRHSGHDEILQHRKRTGKAGNRHSRLYLSNDMKCSGPFTAVRVAWYMQAERRAGSI